MESQETLNENDFVKIGIIETHGTIEYCITTF